MQILTVDIGTGTQDIYLFRSGMAMENGFKLVMPSPTMLVRNRILEATARRENLLLTGVTMGGGPCHWAARDHIQAGLKLYATPEAAKTFNDDLDWVHHEMGVEIVSQDEAASLAGVGRIELLDFDYGAILNAFQSFGLRLNPQAVAVAVFDHGAAPPGVSDRQFRFDYMRDCLKASPHLSAFSYLSHQIPSFLTRFLAVVKSAREVKCPLILMDSAPAAVWGATCDPLLARRQPPLMANIGNFHALAFRLGSGRIEGVFEHHTGLVDRSRLESLLTALARGTLTHEMVYHQHGHGALMFHPQPLDLEQQEFGVAVTGPRRSMLRGSRLRPYFAVPYGDMMLAGCFGLLMAAAHLLPELREPIHDSLSGSYAGVAPWDL